MLTLHVHVKKLWIVDIKFWKLNGMAFLLNAFNRVVRFFHLQPAVVGKVGIKFSINLLSLLIGKRHFFFKSGLAVQK